MKSPFDVDGAIEWLLGQPAYDANNPHKYKHPELGYIEIMALKGRQEAARVKDDRTYDKFQHILDNVKILVDKCG